MDASSAGTRADELELASDCTRCSGLCCVALQITRSSAFAAAKPAGEPCANLGADHRCTIHHRLRESGWSGCTVYECYGAGQRLTAARGSWRDAPVPGRLFAAFSALQAAHEVVFLLRHAPVPAAMRSGRDELLRVALAAADRVEASAATEQTTDELWAPIGPLRSRVGAFLTTVSTRLRRGGEDHAHADLAGRDLRATRLVGGSLRGAVLIGANLAGNDLSGADLLGADLRDCDLRGAALAGALFLTQPQLNAARGDELTTLPPGVTRPAHWHRRTG
ncbi:pentapeptide repeat-containing protein [Cumulibacter manganitolerans]|uniref:pentapeptide repeat-containing protein n=1 Tax=Cumulibacter manganitolerans TaxID=1884992 RepID=UPI001294BADB|nr:pentapeptide repeat-containing protein [Cumulibacter manganitolerans]